MFLLRLNVMLFRLMVVPPIRMVGIVVFLDTPPHMVNNCNISYATPAISSSHVQQSA